MLRFILKRTQVVPPAATVVTDFQTIDVDVPQLEHLLSGGFDIDGSETTDLIGVELLTVETKENG